ncbi:MAG: prolyl oligopeptidase family serine peptidase [Gemmatales bacterium]|nr:prolyl oligopeptidase family serine peptidase [Gemmatales bacterium]MCS7160023.1 prolyl oligopeptidase family serine peptidase [Gemmatales bacterium]MDW8175222.1 prolyl oligopeptidase family serine peptidase [Gemmatales bacterium]MDW8221384.1 prolyl oligopeptidase family serine peptidase [Gemmatales bacterium]
MRCTLAPGISTILMLAMSVSLLAQGQLRYPETKQVEHYDTYHGIKVPDPYRWLEEDVRKSAEVAAWVEAQNKVTFAFLEAIPERPAIRKRLTQLWNFERYTTPFKVGQRYFYERNDGLQNQNALYMLERLDGQPRLLLDPNTWSKDGTIALAGVAVSDDARYLAYAVQEAGSDWRTWKILELDTGRTLEDLIKWTKFTQLAWTKDSRGFFYSRFDEPKPGQEFQALNLNQKVYYHRLGTPQSDDVLVYARPDQPEWGFIPEVTEDGRYLILTVYKGTDDKYRIYYKDLAEPYGLPVALIDHFENEYTFLGNDGPVFYFKTDLHAPRGRIIAVDLRKPKPEHYREIVPQSEHAMISVSFVGNLFIVTYLQDAKSLVRLYDVQGKHIRDVELPGIGSVTGFSGRRSDTETFYTFSSFATPPSIYHYNLITGQSNIFRRAQVDFRPGDYEVKQVFYKSKDGTRVPMFIAHKKGIAMDGNNPTLLYGYGGFNIALTPTFSVSRLLWMEMGGVFALANLRGGGEYGEEWHRAGTRLNKQNVFDDFIAAAEWLIANKYTRPGKLAIQGGSNGGLLVGACMTQRPELFGACLPAVGVMDMLRFHKFTAGRYWVDDYGSPDNPEEFKALYAYSPYHALLRGGKRNYPATLITTADTDDRVVPAHSFKFAAALQAQQAGNAPVLIRIETRAGHGAGKPTSKWIEEIADQWAFLVKVLDFRPQNLD